MAAVHEKTPKFALFLICLCATIVPAQSDTISTFDTGDEGWTAAGDFATPVTWSSTGGNPGGHVEIVDSVTGGVTYFVAPAKFLGNQSAAYNTFLTFDLRQSYPGSPNQFDASDLSLTGNGLTIVYDTPTNPGNNAWTSYSVLLSETAGWRVNTISGPVVTQAEMQSVLVDLMDFRIRAEYQTGDDTGSLDNVRLIPEPSSIALLACAAPLFALGRRWSRRRS